LVRKADKITRDRKARECANEDCKFGDYGAKSRNHNVEPGWRCLVCSPEDLTTLAQTRRGLHIIEMRLNYLNPDNLERFPLSSVADEEEERKYIDIYEAAKSQIPVDVKSKLEEMLAIRTSEKTKSKKRRRKEGDGGSKQAQLCVRRLMSVRSGKFVLTDKDPVDKIDIIGDETLRTCIVRLLAAASIDGAAYLAAMDVKSVAWKTAGESQKFTLAKANLNAPAQAYAEIVLVSKAG